VYRTLSGFFSDNVEYGLRLAESQTSGGKHTDALATVDALRARLPQPDPRLDIVESMAASGLADYARELASIRRAREYAVEHGMPLLSARAYLLEGRSLWNRGQVTEAEPALVKARELFVAGGDRAGEATALNSLATVVADRAGLTQGVPMFEASLAASEAIGDRRGMSSALNNLGIALKDLGRLDEARQAHERSLALRREIADRNWIAISLNNIGVVLFEQDRFREAAAYYQESLAIARDVGDKRGQIRALHNLAVVEREMGHLAEARNQLDESLAMRVEIGDKRGQVAGQVELGSLLMAQGELGAARQSHERVIALSVETQFGQGESQGHYQLGEIAAIAGDFAEARRQHTQALEQRRSQNETRTMAESLVALATLALEEGQLDEAEGLAAEAEDAVRGSGRPLVAAVNLLTARLHLARGNLAGAERELAAARTLAANTERMDLRSRYALTEAQIAIRRGDLDRARAQLDELQEPFIRSGMRIAELERRLVRLAIDRADAPALERDAAALGAGLIASRARAN
jgi:tetratricopeptide (TPR) repeat protein